MTVTDDYRHGYRDGFADGFEKASVLHDGDDYTLSAMRLPPPFVPPPEWIPLRHIGAWEGRLGAGRATRVEACGEVSHYLIRNVSYHEKLDIALYRKLDGSIPIASEVSVCGHCGVDVRVWSTVELDYAAAFIEEEPPKTRVRKKPDPVDEITQALAKLEVDVTKSSKPKPLPKACFVCFETHTGPCASLSVSTP